MSEVTLTAEEAGVLLAVLQSCDWDEPLLPGLIERLAETLEIVLRTPEHADEERSRSQPLFWTRNGRP